LNKFDPQWRDPALTGGSAERLNYLSHYYLNHVVAGVAEEPYFAMGAALPDLWTRFSRTNRIRWSQVRTVEDETGAAAAIRAGMLNHAEADRWFHTNPTFLRWQRDVKRRLSAAAAAENCHPAVLDFLAHVSLELALDSHLLTRDATLAKRFYAAFGACEPQIVETSAAAITRVSTAGLARIISGFHRRQFLTKYDDPRHLARILRLVFAKTRLRICPPPTLLSAAIESALAFADPVILNERCTAEDAEERRGRSP
jgi:hypothetical protein